MNVLSRLPVDFEPGKQHREFYLQIHTESVGAYGHPAIAYCQGTPLRNEIEARDASRLDDVTDRASEAIAARFGDGPVTAKIRAHVVTAMRAGT
jgi:hypothetical protein